MEATHYYPRTIEELQEDFYNAHHHLVGPLNHLLRQISANWDEVKDGHSEPNWEYPLTIPVKELLAQAALSEADIAYINQVIAHVPVDTTDEMAARRANAVTNVERGKLRIIFADVKRGLTMDMVEAFGRLLPEDEAVRPQLVRPHHLPALQVLHILLLCCGFWPKQLQDAQLDLTEAGFNPTNIPAITPENLDRAHTNRESLYGEERPVLNDIDHFVVPIAEQNEMAYAAYAARIAPALLMLALLAHPVLADFNDAYIRYTDTSEV